MYTTFSELGIFMYWPGDSINNLVSYYGLVEVRKSGFEKDLPIKVSKNRNDYEELFFKDFYPNL